MEPIAALRCPSCQCPGRHMGRDEKGRDLFSYHPIGGHDQRRCRAAVLDLAPVIIVAVVVLLAWS